MCIVIDYKIHLILRVYLIYGVVNVRMSRSYFVYINHLFGYE